MKEIEFYTLDVTGQPEFTCSPDECQVTSATTTISGLMDNTSYTITVRAVNCIGEGNYSHPLRIDVPPLFCGQYELLYLCLKLKIVYFVESIVNSTIPTTIQGDKHNFILMHEQQ